MNSRYHRLNIIYNFGENAMHAQHEGPPFYESLRILVLGNIVGAFCGFHQLNMLQHLGAWSG